MSLFHITRSRLGGESAFTLIELIVVIGVMVVLSTVGFTQYATYSRDTRNATRDGHLTEIAAVVDTFVLTTGYAPRCQSGTVGQPGTTSGVCYFTDHAAFSSSKAKGHATSSEGISNSDWNLFSFKSSPEDPWKAYYLYAYNAKRYAVFATKELSDPNGYAALLKGSLPMERRSQDAGSSNLTALNVVADPVLGLGINVLGEKVQGGKIIDSTPTDIKFNAFSSTTAFPLFTANAAIPYRPYTL